MANDGKEYEQFVGALHQALLAADTLAQHHTIEVEQNKKIVDSCGVEREFDLYWEYELAGIEYKTVIECKDYNSRIPVEKIDALIGKIRDIPGIHPVFATKKGYQSGAEQKADHNNIDLLVVREQNDSDWEDVDGSPYIKEVHINSTIKLPARITKFQPLIDAEANDLGTGAEVTISAPDNEILICDDNGNKTSLYELRSELTEKCDPKYGTFSEHVRYASGFVEGPDFKYIIKGYNVEYIIPPPHTEPIVINFAEELVGVIEYLHKGTKKSIFKRGVVREDFLKGKG